MKRDSHRLQVTVDREGVRTAHARHGRLLTLVVTSAAVVITLIAIRLALQLDAPAATRTRGSQRQHAARPVPRPTRTDSKPSWHVRPAAGSLGTTRAAHRGSGPDSVDEQAHAEPSTAYNASAEQAPTPVPSDYGWKGPTGMALFPPPGTNPPKPGIVVPDDFELPPGYMRYYQTTDDGRSLAPILAFHPDYEFVDENGQPVEIPKDRVVPPEMAPPGLPIRILEVPEPHYPTGPSEEELETIVREHPELLEASEEPEADSPSHEAAVPNSEHPTPNVIDRPYSPEIKERFAETLR